MHTWGHHVTHPPAEICEIYSVNSPPSVCQWVSAAREGARRDGLAVRVVSGGVCGQSLTCSREPLLHNRW